MPHIVDKDRFDVVIVMTERDELIVEDVIFGIFRWRYIIGPAERVEAELQYFVGSDCIVNLEIFDENLTCATEDYGLEASMID